MASDYDRLRPPPAPAAIDWLIPAGCEVAVDLAAGTGLFTRPLAQRVPRVIAVEPDPLMRAVLAERTSGVEAVEGTGESIPMGDASVDALFVSSAWHWFDQDRAIPEIARILRDGGRLGVLWSSLDRDVEWVRNLADLRGDAPSNAAALDEHQRRREPQVEPHQVFEAPERESFGYLRSMLVDDVVELMGTYSQVITATPQERAVVLERTREALERQFPGEQEVAFPIRTRCWRATRRAR